MLECLANTLFAKMTDRKVSSGKFDENFISSVRQIQECLPQLKYDEESEPSFEDFEQKIISTEELVELKQSVLLQDLRGLQFANNYSWLCFSIPKECKFNGAIMVNNPFMGLMHTFITNVHQWISLIPELKSLIQKLAPIKDQLIEIQREKTAIKELNEALKNLLKQDPISFIDVKFSLMNAQLKVHQYVQNQISKVKDFDEYDSIEVKDAAGNSFKMEFLFFKQNFLGEFETYNKIKTIVFESMDGFQFDNYGIDVYFFAICLENKNEHRTNKEELFEVLESRIKIFKNMKDLTYFQKEFLHINLPKEFDYTGMIGTNCFHAGLLHSFMRYHSKWSIFIASLYELLEDLGPIKSQLDKIQSAETRLKGLKAFKVIRITLMNVSSNVMLKKLFEAQLQISKFIRENLIWRNYLGERINFRNQLNLFFKVKDLYGNAHAMAIGVSKEIFPKCNEISFKQIRTIFAVYFIGWNQYESFKENLKNPWKSEIASPIVDKKITNFSPIYKRDFLKNAAEHSLNDVNYKGKFPAVESSFDFMKISDKDLKAAIKMDGNTNFDHNEIISQRAFKQNWLHVRMPSKFGYTCAILTNDFVTTPERRSQGLLHVFARHWDQFEKHIPELKKLISDNLSSQIKKLIEKTADTKDPQEYIEFSIALEKDTSLMPTLFKAQLIIYNFILKNVDNYLEDGVHVGKNEMKWQVYFKVDENTNIQNDEQKIKLLGLSREFYSSTENHEAYPRILRNIITSYFITESNYRKTKIEKLWQNEGTQLWYNNCQLL